MLIRYSLETGLKTCWTSSRSAASSSARMVVASGVREVTSRILDARAGQLHVRAALEQLDDPRLRGLRQRRQRLARERAREEAEPLHDPLRGHRVRLHEGRVA